jgi:putative addiction module killer protein
MTHASNRSEHDLFALAHQAEGSVAIMRINARIRRVAETGNFGDAKPVRDGVNEIRIDYGPGYRLYYLQHGPIIVVLLAGGDKSTQDADINRAIEIAKEWKP